MRTVALVLTLLMLMALGACGGEEAGGDEPDITVLDVPATTLEAIAEGQQDGVGMVPVEGAAVKSAEHEDVYFVAMRFSATGIDDQVGVWALDDLETPGMCLSVDGTAVEFTDWGDGGATDAALSMDDPGAVEAKAALD